MSLPRRLCGLGLPVLAAAGLLSLLWEVGTNPAQPASASGAELLTNGAFNNSGGWSYYDGAGYNSSGWGSYSAGGVADAIAQWSNAPSQAGVYEVAVDCYATHLTFDRLCQ